MKNEVTRREAWKSQIIFSIIILWLGTPAVAFVPAFLWLDPDPEKNMQRNLGAGPCKSWKCNDPLEIPSAGALACAPRFPDNMRFNVADFSPQA